MARGRRHVGFLCALIVLGGCSRTHYRIDADREVCRILTEKTAQTPWQRPNRFTIHPDPRSRFHDPTPVEDPLLPPPAPSLYAYQIPELPARDPNRFRSSGGISVPSVEPVAQTATEAIGAGGSEEASSIQQASYEQPAELSEREGTPTSDAPRSADEPTLAEPGQAEEMTGTPSAGTTSPQESDDAQTIRRLAPIPQEAWESLPLGCRRHMFEFVSIRAEHARTYGREPDPDQRDQSRRLALEDIVELASINSREYQTQKENLYRAALTLTLERYDYDLKFALTGNGTQVDFQHSRNGGSTVNRLGIPTTVNGEKVLATGGDLLARFANNVVLTFNGPDGFAADIGSEMLLDISQAVFQRDIAFERLTQAERDVIYAARDFIRYRKELFRDLATLYYRLILSYRGIEISAQDYFSNLRAFNQGEAEYKAGKRPRVEVDQFEQDALSSRSDLIRSSNALEGSLDNLKLRTGLPPELPINLDLNELEELTLQDEATVSGERVRRARRNLVASREVEAPERGVLLNGAIELTRRMLALSELRQRLGEPIPDAAALDVLRARLSVDEARVGVRFNRQVLTQEKSEATRVPVRIFRGTMDLVAAQLILVDRELDLAGLLSASPERIAEVRRHFADLESSAQALRKKLEETVRSRNLDQIPELIREAESRLDDADALAQAADELTQTVPETSEQELQKTLTQVDELLAASQQMLDQQAGALTPVTIDMDDAMLTALVRRFDLMNERGSLADAWRKIQLAGDDLKSVLNLHASQALRTRSDVNRPFDFTFDDSQTRLALEFDAPFNRKQQRNAFRRSLINYQAGLRGLMRLEDTIKLSVRDGLRSLELRREQYRIAVASAALAYERVTSTRLQLQLGVKDVAARDFLESQRAYTESLNSVASEHIEYILDRLNLFLDMELLEVDDDGFWPHLYDDRYQPAPSYQLPPDALPAYGELPEDVHYSDRVRRMLAVPVGTSVIYNQSTD